MGESANVKTIQDIYAAFNRGDITYIINQLAENVSWRAHLDPLVPWGGAYPGKSSVPRFFDAISSAVDVDVFEPEEWVAQGDTVVSIGRFGGKSRGLGKRFNTRWIFVWKVRDGLVISYEQFHEPAIADAFR